MLLSNSEVVLTWINSRIRDTGLGYKDDRNILERLFSIQTFFNLWFEGSLPYYDFQMSRQRLAGHFDIELLISMNNYARFMVYSSEKKVTFLSKR